jgi:hypothetical protein
MWNFPVFSPYDGRYAACLCVTATLDGLVLHLHDAFHGFVCTHPNHRAPLHTTCPDKLHTSSRTCNTGHQLFKSTPAA